MLLKLRWLIFEEIHLEGSFRAYHWLQNLKETTVKPLWEQFFLIIGFAARFAINNQEKIIHLASRCSETNDFVLIQKFQECRILDDFYRRPTKFSRMQDSECIVCPAKIHKRPLFESNRNVTLNILQIQSKTATLRHKVS
eukprot:TRINITY_DN238_c0_g1_i10.p3 TRINITY_DN238_c0_g1~~TRINITY_DN238_c0_g1_i10.p3  ORF type:complete len:140 (+),score=0.08 TRINITY_DN238_c0_g1_i10:1007-1426(+)